MIYIVRQLAVTIVGDVKGGDWVDHSAWTGDLSQLIHDAVIVTALLLILLAGI